MNTKKLGWRDLVKQWPCLSPDQCKDIIEFFKIAEANGEVKPVEVYHHVGEQTHSDARVGDVFEVPDESQLPHWRKIRDRLIGYNENTENFNLNGKYQINILRYPVGGWFKKHKDGKLDLDHRLNLDSERKISATIQLSNEEDYNGGELVMIIEKNIKGSKGSFATKNQGDIIIFPSYVDHQVNKVVRGERYSIVIWAYGPPWK